MSTASKGPTFRERMTAALDIARRLGILLLLLVGGVLVVVLAWTHMNLVTFLLFSALVAWVGYNDWRQSEVEETVRLAEKRLRALEVHVGLGEAWLEELKAARIAQQVVGGNASEHVRWPQNDPLEPKLIELQQAVLAGDHARANRLRLELGFRPKY